MKGKLIFLTLFIAAAFILSACTAEAAVGQVPATDAPATLTINEFVTALANMVGITALIVVTVNILKAFKVVKDGDAPTWVKTMHAVVYLVLIGWYLIKPDTVDLGVIDSIASQIAQLGIALLALVPASAGLLAPEVNAGVRGLPVVGYSYSLNK